MSRRVRTKVSTSGTEVVDCPSDDVTRVTGWAGLPDDAVIQIFSCLNYRDRANLSSTCQKFRVLGKSPRLWQTLDVRNYKFGPEAALSLSARCQNLRKLQFRGLESADAVIYLQAKELREINACCWNVPDSTLSVIVARHEALESLDMATYNCEMMTSDALKAVAICCSKLRRLRLGLKEVDACAINALAEHCPNLTEVGFVDCGKVDERAIGNLTSIRFLSISGTRNVNWNIVRKRWAKLPNLLILDVTDTDITPKTVSRLFSSSISLKVLCAMCCPRLEEDPSRLSTINSGDRVLVSAFTNILEGVASLFVDTPHCATNIFLNAPKFDKEEAIFGEILHHLEMTLCNSLIHFSFDDPMDKFWFDQGTILLLTFMQSPNEEVREGATLALLGFVMIHMQNIGDETVKAEAVVKHGGIQILFNLATSWQEGIQSQAVQAIEYLAVNANVAKVVAEVGGIKFLLNLLKCGKGSVADEAAKALWSLSLHDECKKEIVEGGGLETPINVLLKWLKSRTTNYLLLGRVTGAIADMASDDKCSSEIVSLGGVTALLLLFERSENNVVLEGAARAIANLALALHVHGDNSAVGSEEGPIEALVQLVRSDNDGVRQEAVEALRKLSFVDDNRVAIAAAGGVEALVALAIQCSTNSPPSLQNRVASALWGLSASREIGNAIVQEGGVVPLIQLAQSEAKSVQEAAAGALWSLSFNPVNAIRIMDEGGAVALVDILSGSSKLARFISALALAYMFDGRTDEISSTESISKSPDAEVAFAHIKEYMVRVLSYHAVPAAAFESSTGPEVLAGVARAVHIQEASYLICGDDIVRCVEMLRNPSPVLKGCAAFALFQFTVPGPNSEHHVSLLKNEAGSEWALRVMATAGTGYSTEARIFARVVLRNLDLHQGT